MLLIRRLALAAGVLAAASSVSAQARYGDDPSAGDTFVHDGVRLYYEIYGAGEPLLLVHGNGGSIADWRAQIDFFRKHYRVIAMDSRSQGRSGTGPDSLSYEQMSDDLAALLDHVRVGPAYVLGWSDGGIEALLLGIRHPGKVKKIASMAANISPADSSLYPEVTALVRSGLEAAPPGSREHELTRLVLEQPHIDPASLASITAPTLIMAGDHDVILDQHTLEIFHHIPNAQLAIFPDATHMIPYDDPARFNAAVERFFRTPFVQRDRVKDVLRSMERLRAPGESPSQGARRVPALEPLHGATDQSRRTIQSPTR
jgi:pimeloyl-ACP methyl ester carboxylesterase